MKINSLIAASLEDAGVVITDVDERTPGQILLEENEDSASEEIIESVDMIESLEALAVLSRKFVTAKIASMESAELIQFAAGEIMRDKNFAANIGYGFENFTDANVYHENIAASLEGVASNIGSRISGLFKTRVAQFNAFFSTGENALIKINKRLGELQNYLISNFDESGLNDISFSLNGMHSFQVGGKYPSSITGAMADSQKVLSDVLGVANDYDKNIDSLIGLLGSAKSDEDLKAAVGKLGSPVLDSPFSNNNSVSLMGNWKINIIRSDNAISTGWGPVSFKHRIRATGEHVVKAVIAHSVATTPGIGQIFGRKTIAASDIKGAIEATIKSNDAMIRAAKERKAKEYDISTKLAESARKATAAGVSVSTVNTVSQIVADQVAGKDVMMKSVLNVMGVLAGDQLGAWSSIVNRTKTVDKPKFEEPAPTSVFSE